MKTLKLEQVRDARWKDLDELRADLRLFFETTYNRERLHSSLGYQTPEAFELACAVNPVTSGSAGARRPSPQTPLPDLQSIRNCP